MSNCPAKGLLAICLLLLALPAAAHQVRHEVTRAEALTVSLTYADGTPLAGARYEIWAEGDEGPCLTGKTDLEGQIVFLPNRQCTWRIRAFTADGHGADFTVEAGPGQTTVVDSKKPLLERFAGPVLGVGIIFLVFGLLALARRRH